MRRRRAARAPQQASGRRRSGGLRGVGLLGGGRRRRGAGRAEKTAGWTRGLGVRRAVPLHPESCWPLDCGPRHRTVLWGRGRTAAKFKRLNLTALADTAGRGGRGRGVGLDSSHVGRGRGLAGLPFVLAGACAEGRTRGFSWARPFSPPPPKGWSSRASPAGVGSSLGSFP